MGSKIAGATHHLQWPPTPFWKALRVYLSYEPGEVDGRAAVRPCGGGKHATTTAPEAEIGPKSSKSKKNGSETVADHRC